MIRCGAPANISASTFWLLTGKTRNPVFTDEFLVEHGAAPFSSIIMTENAFLTDDAWRQLVPLLIKGIRYQVATAAARLCGIDVETAKKLLVALAFDGFKVHLKNMLELVLFAEHNVLCACEARDSSEVNQVRT